MTEIQQYPLHPMTIELLDGFRSYLQTNEGKKGKPLSSRSIEFYMDDIQTVARNLQDEGVGLGSINQRSLDAYFSKQNCSLQTAKRKASVVNKFGAFLREAHDTEVDIDPFRKLSQLEFNPPRVSNPLTRSEFYEFVAMIREHYQNEKGIRNEYNCCRDIFTASALYHTRILVEQVLALQTTQVNQEQDALIINLPLSDQKSKTIRIHKTYYEIDEFMDKRDEFVEYRKNEDKAYREDPSLLLNKSGKRISAKSLRTHFELRFSNHPSILDTITLQRLRQGFG